MVDSAEKKLPTRVFIQEISRSRAQRGQLWSIVAPNQHTWPAFAIVKESCTLCLLMTMSSPVAILGVGFAAGRAFVLRMVCFLYFWWSWSDQTASSVYNLDSSRQWPRVLPVQTYPTDRRILRSVRSDDHYSYSVVALALFVRQDIFGRSVHCLWRRSPAQLFQQLAFVHLLPHMLILSNNLTIEHFYNSCPKTCILRRLHTGSLTVIPPGNSIWKHVPRVRPWTGGKRPRGNRVWSYSLFPRIFRISIIKGFWGHETQMFLINNIYSTRTDV